MRFATDSVPTPNIGTSVLDMVNRLWEAANRPMAMPDSQSVTRSPTGSIRTILSIDSRTSTSSTGSRSTAYVPPLRSHPSIPDFSSNASSTSSRSGGLSRRTSIASSHHIRAVDDTVISNQDYVYPGDPRAIQPARTGSLPGVVGARPGLGFANLVFGGGAPVTISSGPALGRDIVVTPPPSTGRGSDRACSDASDEQFFMAGSSEGSRSSYYSQASYLSELRTSTGLRTGGTSFFDSSATGTRALPSTTSYTRTDSTWYLGDSQTSMSHTGTSPSRTPLSRTREVRRRGGRSSSRSYSSGTITDASSDKENLSGSYTHEIGTCLSELDSENFVAASQGSSDYLTARSPPLRGSIAGSEASFASFPTIPSESEYKAADTGYSIPSEQNPPTLSSVKLDCEEATRSALGLPSLPPSEIPSIRSPSMFSEDVLPPLPPSESSPFSIHLTPSPPPPLPPLPPSLPSLSPPPSPLTPAEEPLDIALPTSYRSPTQVFLPRSPSSEACNSIPPLSATISSSASDATLPSLVLPSSPAPSEHPPTPSLVFYLQSHHFTDDSYESSQLAPPPSVISLAVPEGIGNSFETSFLRPSGSRVSSVDRLSRHPRGTDERIDDASVFAISAAHPGSYATVVDLIIFRCSHTIKSPGRDVDSPPPIDTSTPGTFSLSRLSFPTLSAVSSLAPPTLSSPDVRTPSDVSFSDEQHPQLARSRSTASVASFRSQSSLNSSVFDARSLLEEEDLETVDEPSAVPSLLTTPSQADRQLHSPFSMTGAQLRTPELPSMNVSLSTPRGSAQTTQSSLRTQTSESAPPERDLSCDIDRIADDLRRYHDARGNENRDLGDNIRALRDELRHLSQYLHRTPSPRARPSQPLLDQMIGGSSPVYSLLPGDHRDMSVTSLSRATSSASGIGSYLSYHHSGDEYLASESYHDSPPPWHAPTISESDDSFPRVGPSRLDPQVLRRPLQFDVARFLRLRTSSGPLEAAREQLNALREGQVSTKHMLDRLVGDRTTQTQDNPELRDRLLRIEELLQGLSNQPPRKPHIIYEQYPPAPISSIGSAISLQQLADQLRGFEADQDIPARYAKDHPWSSGSKEF
ncbi:hypothetical protein FPV67DRAFT_1764052 [Lyophyllum atratum]|nr:hypothetical protein FPV67DRAFT_1764052 [Lyophyllum atratum]